MIDQGFDWFEFICGVNVLYLFSARWSLDHLTTWEPHGHNKLACCCFYSSHGCPDQKAFGCYSHAGLPNFESIDGSITMELKLNLKYSGQKLQDCNSCNYHDHVINSAIIDNCKQLSIRKLSDSWHTMTTTRADNNSCSLSVLLSLFYLLKNCSLVIRKLAFLKHLKPEKKFEIHLKACLHTIGIVISNFANHTIPSLPSRGRLKGLVP